MVFAEEGLLSAKPILCWAQEPKTGETSPIALPNAEAPSPSTTGPRR